MGTLAVAVLSAGSALVGAQIGASATLEANGQQLQEERATATRAKRAQVYADYLAAANQYSVENGRFLVDVRNNGGQTPAKLDQKVQDAWIAARSRYQDTINLLYVYGSDEAWRVHRGLAATLPPSLETVKVMDVDLDRFRNAYREFQTVFCREAPAIPRAGCNEH